MPCAHRVERNAAGIEPDRIAAILVGIDAIDHARAAAGTMGGDRAHHQIGAAAVIGTRGAVADQRNGLAARAIESASLSHSSAPFAALPLGRQVS
jgi:hypothetical protein